MILCVCLNPALDVTYRLDAALERGRTHRVRSIDERAGGKAINVARLLTDAGLTATVLAPVGGAAGTVIRTELAVASIGFQLVHVQEPTRRTVAVVDPLEATVLNEAGPHLSEREWAALEAAFVELAPTAELIVLAGSLPPGVPVDAYRRLIERAAGRPVVVDAGAEVLAATLSARPYLVKPNRSELAAVVEGEPDQIDLLKAAQELQHRGAANVVISDGREGLVAVTEAGCWQVRAEPVTGNPTGAGDALTAALVIGTQANRPWPERLRAGAAMSAAAVADPVAGHVDPQVQARLDAGVVIRRLEQ